jgi:hypothetical protein
MCFIIDNARAYVMGIPIIIIVLLINGHHNKNYNPNAYADAVEIKLL